MLADTGTVALASLMVSWGVALAGAVAWWYRRRDARQVKATAAEVASGEHVIALKVQDDAHTAQAQKFLMDGLERLEHRATTAESRADQLESEVAKLKSQEMQLEAKNLQLQGQVGALTEQVNRLTGELEIYRGGHD